MAILRSYAVGVLLGVRAASAMADTATAKFDVNITLKTEVSPSICISQSLSDALGAIVKVVCNTRRFVSIQPSPTKSFFGTVGSFNAMRTALATSVSNNNTVSATDSSTTISESALKSAQLVFEDRFTGERIAFPSLFRTQTSAVEKYRLFFGNTATETTQSLSVADIQDAPIEMLISF